MGWVFTALGDKASGLGNGITTKATQYSADIVAASANGRSFKRIRVVIDTQKSPPRIIYRRDLSDQGWPLDTEVLNSLRQGNVMISGNQSLLGGVR
jgi:hypothetical protein